MFGSSPTGALVLLHYARFVCCAALVVLSACQRESNVARLEAVSTDHATPTVVAPINEDLSPRLLRRFAPIQRAPGGPETALVSLGRMLYFEPLLSRTG